MKVENEKTSIFVSIRIGKISQDFNQRYILIVPI